MNGELSQVKLAKALGLAKSRISALKKAGMPVTSIEDAQAWRTAHQSIARRKPGADRAAAPAANAGAADDADRRQAFDLARTRREVAEANLAELREAELRGELIRVSAVEAGLAQMLVGCRNHLLQLSARLAPLLAAEKDAFKVGHMLDQEMHQALHHLANSPLQRPAPMESGTRA